MAPRALALLVNLLAVAHCCLGQIQEAQLNRTVELRLSSITTTNASGVIEYYGPLEVFSGNGSWIKATRSTGYLKISNDTGNVVCRSLGYGPYRDIAYQYSYYYNYYYYNGYYYGYESYFNLSAVNCNGNESTIAECSQESNPQFNGYSNPAVFIRCAESRCATSNNSCSQICFNNPVITDQLCGCHKGYSLKPGSLTDCADIDECLVNNGGCSFNCINTPGSYLCTCPIFTLPSNISGECTATGLKLTCESDRMSIAFAKQAYAMLSPDEVTLLGSECTPSSNGTHIMFTTSYKSCRTVQSEDTRGVIFSNAIVRKDGQRKSSNVTFASTINIPFYCVMRRRGDSALSMPSTPLTLTTTASAIGKTNMRLKLCYDSACTLALEGKQIKQGTAIFALLELTSQDRELKLFVKRCSARAKGKANGEQVDLIRDGQSAAPWVTTIKSIDEPSFKFFYPAFTLGDNSGSFVLECLAVLQTATSPTSGLSQTTLRSTFTSNSIGLPSTITRSSSTQAKTSVFAPTLSTSRATFAEQTNFSIVSSCEEAKRDGIHQLILGNRTVPVWCDTTSPGGPWLTVMRRTNSWLNFNRTWAEYEAGFGNIDHEFWLGNAYLHEITRYHGATLRIELTTFANVSKFAEYSTAVVGDSSGGYNLTLGSYQGSAGDMRNTSGCISNVFIEKPVKFSTYDTDNDELAEYKCAGRGGGWWYHDCMCTCLSCGPSSNRQIATRSGMTYFRFNGLLVLKKSEMKIRFGTLKAVYPNSVSAASSTVDCDTQHVTIILSQGTLHGPFEASLAMHGASFVNQSFDGTHIMLTFSLWGADTVRKENVSHIVYYKLAAAETTSPAAYYRRLVMQLTCILDKSITMQQEYAVGAYDAKFMVTGSATFEAKIIMARDASFSAIFNNTSTPQQGSTVYIKVVPVKEELGLHITLISCNLSGASVNSEGYQVIKNRCSVHEDVEVIARDTFVTRLPSFALDDKGTRVSCDVQVCSSNDDTCGYYAGTATACWSAKNQA